MKHFSSLVLLLLVGVASTTKYASIWPHTQSPHLTEHFLLLNPAQFHISSSNPQCDIIDAAIKRYSADRLFIQDCSKLDPTFKGHYFYPHALNHVLEPGYSGSLTNLTIKFDGPCERLPHMNMKEGYKLIVDAKTGAEVHGESVWGALRGLETFSQMVVNVGRDQFVVNTGTIDDWPRFSHRGLLIDTARHYQPLKYLYQTLDAMEMNKLNVFHWHIVDDQSFPYVSETFPDLSKNGAYSPSFVYSKADVDAILEYARLRGIRVLVEFDSPGHTNAWGKGQKGLLTPCYTNGKPNGQFGPVDPTQDGTYSFIQKLFTEIVNRFPDQYLHLGGDEVPFSCWESNPAIKEFMTKHRMAGDYKKLESYYIQKLVDIVQHLNRSYIVWEEVFDNAVSLNHNTVVHVWKGNGQTELAKVTKAGYKALLSAPWYLDQITWTSDWIKYYNAEPLHFNGTAEQKKLVMGGEACLWAEYVDGSNLIAKAWPRASSIAERLWSPEHMKDATAARGRFRANHCRMQKLGLRPAPIDGPSWCPCDAAL